MSGDGVNFDATEIAKAKLEGLKVLEEKAKKEQAIADAIGDQLSAAQKLIEVERIRYDTAIAHLEKLKDQKGAFEEMLTNAQNVEDGLKNILRESKLNADEQEKIIASMKNQDISLDGVVEKIKEFRSQQEISKDLTTDIKNATSKLARSMGIHADFSKSALGSAEGMFRSYLKSDQALSKKAMLGAISGLINPLNIVSSLFDTMIKKVLEFDKASVELKIATGFTNDFQSTMVDLNSETVKFGISMAESNKALGAVYKNISGMNKENEKLAKSLAFTASQLTKLGVSAETTAKNQNLLLKSMGMNGPQVERTLLDIAGSGEDLGLTADQMSTQFASSMEYLLSFGDEGVQSFKELAAQAGVTGLAISDMLSMTKEFDKFSSGAKKAATLNSVLGTSISSMAMMNMNAAQRSKELRNQINLATGGVKNLTQAQRLFIAEQLYGGNVAKMLADLDADPAKLREREEIAKQRADIQERMAKAMTELLPLTQRITMAFEALATNKDVMKALGNAIEFVVNAVTFFVQNGNILLPTLAALRMGIALLTMETYKLATAKKVATAQAGGIAAMILFFATTVENPILRTGLFVLAAGIYAMGFASQVSGGKLAALATIFMIIAGVLGMSINPLFIQFGFFMAIGIIAMGIAADIAGYKLIFLGIALALVAAGVALVFYGMAAVVDSITSLFTVLIGGVDALPIITLSLIALGMAFVFLGNMATFGSIGIFLGLAALGAMLLLFKLTGTSMKDMFGAGEEILKIGQGVEAFANGLASIKSSIAQLKSSIGSDQLLAASMIGDSSSIVMGKNVAVASLFRSNKIQVDVKMPKLSMPEINVTVKIGEKELEQIIQAKIDGGQL